MSKLILSKFKKSLGQSSNIISDSRMSSSFHRDLNMLQGIERTPEAEKEYTDKSSLNNTYRNNLDHNKLIKKIPQLISENDELKEKVNKLQEQLSVILQYQKKRTSFSFRQQNFREDDDISKFSIHKRTSKIEETAYPKSNIYSLEHNQRATSQQKYRHSLYNSSFQKESNIKEQLKALKDTINELQANIRTLKLQNKILEQQNSKFYHLKQENGKQIDRIMQRFQQTLNHKEELSKTQASLFEQKIQKMKNDLQKTVKQKNMLAQECEKLRKQLQGHQQYIYRMMGAQDHIMYEKSIKQIKFNEFFKLTDTIEHLWKVKDAQYFNIANILRALNPSMP